MTAYVLDLKADKDWIKLVEAFKTALLNRLGESLLKIVALHSPEDRVYDSNVLVIVDRDEPDVIEAVLAAAMEAEKAEGVEGIISPLVTTPNERRVIEGFERSQAEEKISEVEWRSLVEVFCKKLVEKLRPIKIVALHSPEDRVYDSNVLVIVDRDEPDVIEAVLAAAMEAEKAEGVEGIISPLVTTPNERRVIEGFRGREVVCWQGDKTT